MDKDEQKEHEYSIGRKIKEVYDGSGLSRKEFAKRINVHRVTLYDIFERSSINTHLLILISRALNYNFFEEINDKINNDNTPMNINTIEL